ncbi:MAG: hypothetical protein ACK4K5_03265 [Thermosynechococcus sp.]
MATIIDIAVNTPGFSTLVTAVKVANLANRREAPRSSEGERQDES